MYLPKIVVIIKIDFTSDDKLEGVKVTGDPNVPFREKTFIIDLNASLFIETINQYQTHDLMDIPLVFNSFKEIDKTKQTNSGHFMFYMSNVQPL